MPTEEPPRHLLRLARRDVTRFRLRGLAHPEREEINLNDLRSGREGTFCGCCVLEDVPATGPLADRHRQPRRDEHRVHAEREEFVRRLSTQFPGTPAAELQVFVYEWRMSHTRCRCVMCPRRSMTAFLQNQGVGGIHSANADAFHVTHQRDLLGIPCRPACCPCLAARHLRRTLPPLHGVYVDVWPGLERATLRALDVFIAHRMLRHNAVVFLVGFPKPTLPPSPTEDV